MTSESREVERCEPIELRSAQGYFELGMLEETRSALSGLTLRQRLRPDVLELSVLILIEERRWKDVLRLCAVCVRRFPSLAFGHVNKAYALHELGGTEEALEVLESANEIVAIEPVALYNRGCYLVKLARPSEGVFWLNKAFRVDPNLRSWAEMDPDLAMIRHDLELGCLDC